MIKQQTYPKTKRIGSEVYYITEKLDGSNLGFLRDTDGLLIAQRNLLMTLEEALDPENKLRLYKGLVGWLQEHGKELEESLVVGSAVFGEWIGMGRIKYGDTLDKRFYMFAKANLDFKNHTARNIKYDYDLFRYPFIEQKTPDFIGVVPLISVTASVPDIEHLNELYEYESGRLDRPIEGFIVAQGGVALKYVRHKEGKLMEHHG